MPEFMVMLLNDEAEEARLAPAETRALIEGGLTEARECFKECSNAWGFYVNDSLRALITTGEGKPD